MSGIASIFSRLPMGFLIPFAILILLWTFLFEHLNNAIDLRTTLNSTFLQYVSAILLGLFVLIIYLLGLFGAYNISVLIHRKLIQRKFQQSFHPEVLPHRPAQNEAGSDLFKTTDKIGIVLAGGGAKGAFQAGAMKAIYRFLAEHDALNNVKVIAATSIGSWNALFWMADLMKSEEGWEVPSVHEKWWASISLKSLVALSWYFPTRRNAFCDTMPWQKSFDDIFMQPAVQKRISESGITFYFTKSNVGSGKLVCTTNKVGAKDIPRVRMDEVDLSKGFQGVKSGVFASMDLPPLFPYETEGADCFEDGGVIDNLPIMFAGMESCDFIFVLPLTSDYEAIPNHRSLLNRFLRVMDVRQGALERNSLKVLYLYNELAAMREYVLAIEGPARTSDIKKSETLENALRREHKQAHVFAVCPVRKFVERTIDTQEFWKGKEAAIAFDVMYQTTLKALRNDFYIKHERIRVALVSQDKTYRWDHHF